MELIFLGTSSMVPTSERNHTAVALTYKGETLLFDCGEGTQRQIRRAKLSPTKISKLFISHWHGDHVLGIPGLVQTLGELGYDKTLEVYGPKRTEEFMEKILQAFLCHGKIAYKATDVTEGKILETKDYEITAIKLEHSTLTIGYLFKEKDVLKINLKYLEKFGLTKHPILKDLQQGKDIKWKDKKIKAKDATITKKGKKIAILFDTGMTPELEKKIVKSVKDFDLLIMESTFGDELALKGQEYGHLHTTQSAKIAKKAKVGKLFLTHISQRYKSTKEMEQTAKKTFKNSTIAKDFMKIEL